MKPSQIVAATSNGIELCSEDIDSFVRAVTDGDVSDDELVTWLKAVCEQGLTGGETTALTEAMLRSGLAAQPDLYVRPAADKHATGGVGDTTSLVLAPAAAAAGVAVPMISGRGLGHTGGTLDKLETIYGYNVDATLAELVFRTNKTGGAMVGQSPELAPADRIMYATRHRSGTVNSIPLICASIMSKKLAEGLTALTLDVKVGSGAFMATLADAQTLGDLMCTVGEAFGVRTHIYYTNMNQPLGRAVGNGVEMVEALRILRGQQDSAEDLTYLIELFGARMLYDTGVVGTLAEGEQKIRDSIASGAALDIFNKMVRDAGGDVWCLDDEQTFLYPHTSTVRADRPGHVHTVDPKLVAVGAAAVDGDGRGGVWLHAKVGDAVNVGDVLATIRYNGKVGVGAEACRHVGRAYHVGEKQVHIPTVIYP